MPRPTRDALRSAGERATRLAAVTRQTVDRAREAINQARNTRQVTVNRRLLSKFEGEAEPGMGKKREKNDG
jgi:ABC-type transporter Mla subunit MlaD